jgi:ADP-ribose pyrophosphatase YjhB (NUDIX family)
MSYVTLVLRRVFGFPRERAEELMLRVHHEGRAVVAEEPREQAELHVAQLHGYGLQASLERDADGSVRARRSTAWSSILEAAEVEVLSTLAGGLATRLEGSTGRLRDDDGPATGWPRTCRAAT